MTSSRVSHRERKGEGMKGRNNDGEMRTVEEREGGMQGRLRKEREK